MHSSFLFRCLARCLPCLLLSACLSSAAHADYALAWRAGTFGFGIEVDRSLRPDLNLRLGYHLFSRSRNLHSEDVDYDAALTISAASAIVDWHAWQSPLHFSAGLSMSGPEARLRTTPSGDTYTFNGQTYAASDIGRLDGTVKQKYPVAPYVGVGWGNVLGDRDRFTLLVELGALYGGGARARLDVSCNAALADTCAQLLTDIEAEKARLERDWGGIRWWPVVSLGFSIRL